jgi:hypothetical protein
LHGVGAANAGAKFHETSGNHGKTWEKYGETVSFRKKSVRTDFFSKKNMEKHETKYLGKYGKTMGKS